MYPVFTQRPVRLLALIATAVTALGCPVTPTVEVADFVGMSRPGAEAALTAAGLTVGGISEEYSETVPSGQVIRQDPVTGTMVAEGTAVALVISLGPDGAGGDGEAPVISLRGDDPVTIEVHTDYTDAGATATDNYDGDLTGSVITVNPVDTSLVGTYTVTYDVSDASGNAAVRVTRTVNVVDLGTDPRGEVDPYWDYLDASTLEDDYDRLDYVWDRALAAAIVLNGDSIDTGGAVGASATESVLSISASGTYVLSGTLTDGRIIVETAKEDEGVVRLVFDGVDIACGYSAPIYVGNAEKTVILLADGTENRLTDAQAYTYLDNEAEEEPNAALFSKDYLTIGAPADGAGTGQLTVMGNYLDGVASKDGLVLNGGVLTVSAIDDGIRGKDYLVVITGEVYVTTASGDGLKSDETDNADRGYVSFEGGLVDVVAGGDGVQAETYILGYGGDVTVQSGGGAGVAFDEETESKKALKAVAGVLVRDGSFLLDAADDAVHADGFIEIAGGVFDIETGDDGIHGDVNVLVRGGDIGIWASYEGMESTVITIRDGNIHIVSSDDGLNCADGSGGGGIMPPPPPQVWPETTTTDFWLYIEGGYLAVYAQGDGLDSNGGIEMTGGTAIVHGPTARDNGTLDSGDTGGGIYVDGGLLVGSGSSGMPESPDAESAQNYRLLTFAAKSAGTLVHIESASGQEVLTFRPSKVYETIVLSSPGLVSGVTYNVYFGGTCSGGTETEGLYVGGAYAGGTMDPRLSFSPEQ